MIFDHLLASIWISIIAFAIIMYVILDGFDLGIGILSPFVHEAKHRDIMISTILPVWDGNETWLVFGGACLFGAFPLAFSVLLPNLYLPMLIMVMALLFRGVAFEFRLKADTSKQVWEWSFFGGSLVATFMQGVLLGAFIEGFREMPHHIYVLTYNWLSPFSVGCGIALIFGYALLGSTWLISKTTGKLQDLCYKYAKITLLAIAVIAVAISFWTPLVDPQILSRWLDPQLMVYLSILPLSSILIWLAAWRALTKRKELSPFWLTIGIFMTCYVGFIISSWPYIIPRFVPFWDAAAPRNSLIFMLIGACIMIPVLLAYTYYAYRVFRGKVTDVIGY
jgi:cytochrome d ubiquinol oxidase subunit II